MKLFKKVAPSRLSRAIVALAARSSKKVSDPPANNLVRSEECGDRGSGVGSSHAETNQRTTITVETERLLILRSERISSTTHSECRHETGN